MTEKINNCQLEIDRIRGVIYVHSPEGKTLVRICQIPPMVIDRGFIDVVFDRELARNFLGVKTIAEEEKEKIDEIKEILMSRLNKFNEFLKNLGIKEEKGWTRKGKLIYRRIV